MEEVSVLRSSFNGGVIPQGVVTNDISAFWDFLPTIGELGQADIPQNIDGISYLPTLTGKVLRRSMIVFIMSSLNLEESNLL